MLLCYRRTAPRTSENVKNKDHYGSIFYKDIESFEIGRKEK